MINKYRQLVISDKIEKDIDEINKQNVEYKKIIEEYKKMKK